MLSVSQKGTAVTFQLGETSQLIIKAIGELSAEKYRNRLLFDAGSKPCIIYKFQAGTKQGMLGNIKKLLLDIKNSAV